MEAVEEADKSSLNEVAPLQISRTQDNRLNRLKAITTL
jgi:hypothetical protein